MASGKKEQLTVVERALVEQSWLITQLVVDALDGTAYGAEDVRGSLDGLYGSNLLCGRGQA